MQIHSGWNKVTNLIGIGIGVGIIFTHKTTLTSEKCFPSFYDDIFQYIDWNTTLSKQNWNVEVVC